MHALWPPLLLSALVVGGCRHDPQGGSSDTGAQTPSVSGSAVAATASADAGAPQPIAGPSVSLPALPAGLSRPAGTLLRSEPDAGTDGIACERLPRYEIDQAIDDVSGSFAGKLVLRYVNDTTAPLATVPLRLHPNASGELGVNASDAGELRITEAHQATSAGATRPAELSMERPTLAVVRLADPVAVGDSVQLTVSYTGRFRRLADDVNDIFSQAISSLGTLTAGVGAADYGLVAVGDGIVTAASAYPMVAPYRDGDFDTAPPTRFGDLAYNEIAQFRVRTVAPAGVAVVTNLVDSAPQELADGRRVVVSAGCGVRDFVLVAGRDFATKSVQQGPTRVTSIYRQGDARAGQLVLDAAVASLRCFEKAFGPYPYRELDVAEASLVGGAGGVEFSAMVLIAGMLYRSPTDSASPMASMMRLMGKLAPPPPTPGSTSGPAPPTPDRMLDDMLGTTLEFTVAHEVAHQYFAGIVGNDSRRFPSLDEPIAQYSAGLVMADRHGQAAAKRIMDANVKLNYAAYRLLGGADRPVLRDTDSFATAIEYAALVYGKAPYLYVELRQRLGAERLHRAIREAIEQHRFELVTTEQWITALEKGAGGPPSQVRAVFKRWLEQTHGDADLRIGDPGRFVIGAVLPPEMAAAVSQSFGMLGMKPGDLFRLFLGGPLSSGGATP